MTLVQIGRRGNISHYGPSKDSMRRRTFLQIAAAPVFAQSANSAAGIPWNQWGGPNRNFQTDATGLKDQWPAGGPKVVWRRPLGEGYSSAAGENNVLSTMSGSPGEAIARASHPPTRTTLSHHA